MRAERFLVFGSAPSQAEYKVGRSFQNHRILGRKHQPCLLARFLRLRRGPHSFSPLEDPCSTTFRCSDRSIGTRSNKIRSPSRKTSSKTGRGSRKPWAPLRESA